MKRKWIFLLFICSLLLLFSGCERSEPSPGYRVVTQVDISCQQKDLRIERHYTQSQKMEYILLYLRLVKSLGSPATDPDTIDADVFQITVHLSDGSQKVYRQKDHRYFSRHNAPWQQMDPAHAAELYRLLREIPDDQV